MKRAVHCLILFVITLCCHVSPQVYARKYIDIVHQYKPSLTIDKGQCSGKTECKLLYIINKSIVRDVASTNLVKVQRGADAENVIKNNFINSKEGKYVLNSVLWNSFLNVAVLNKNYSINTSNAKRVAHTIATDALYNITGEARRFDGKILYVGESGKYKYLTIVDQDGSNEAILTTKDRDVRTPIYIRKFKTIAYVSMVKGVPSLKFLSLDKNKTSYGNVFDSLKEMRIISPTISRDNKFMAFSALEGYHTNIYKLNLEDGKLQKLTTKHINTSPTFSLDGDSMAYQSNKDGRQQIYVMKFGWFNSSKRISSGRGAYAEPSWSPDGNEITFSKILGNRFHIAVMGEDGENEEVLYSNYLAENPSWSPSGEGIIFSASKTSKHNQLTIVNRSSRKSHQLKVSSTDVLDPMWILP